MEKMIKTEPVVLAESSMVPDNALIEPPPNQFTHELTQQQSYYFTGAHQSSPPDGEFPAGTKVVLMVYHGGGYCRVIDEQGLYVETDYKGLRKIKAI